MGRPPRLRARELATDPLADPQAPTLGALSLFAPERGVENPIIRRAISLCEDAGMKIVYHEDTVEVWFAPNNRRFYTIWSQFLADAEAIFGDRMHAPAATTAPARNGFGNRGADHGDTAVAEQRSAAAAAPDAQLTAELTRLKTELKILERAIKVVGMQREEWKKEAESLREQLSETRVEVANLMEARMANSPGGTDRYKAIRQVIVRRLHPDIPGSDEEKAYREKLFKMIWKEIEILDKK